VKITILGAPDYLCEISSSTKEEGEEGIMLALDAIKDEAGKVRGEFKL
jgi:translation initiation factor 2 alpha subunit (eIF-2alpha)